MVLQKYFAKLPLRRPCWLLAIFLSFLGLAGAFLHSWTLPQGQAAERSESWISESAEPIQPIEPIRNLDPRKIHVGKQLFEDLRLSHNNQLSCATCHIVRLGGADGKAHSVGIYGATGMVNAPTVLNSVYNFSQFWDGRADTLEKQMDEPVQSATEMGSSWPEVIGKLNNAREYSAALKSIYGRPIDSAQIKNCVAEYERSLSTPNSRFDRFLRHEANALSSREQRGYQLFKSMGCISCHQGIGVGGNMYQKVGVMAPYFKDRGQINEADLGRYNVTKDPRDRYMFKVPSLRNVDLTAPYFHDGSANTLVAAVSMMAKYQLGNPLVTSDAQLIVEFLKTLTGELGGRPL